MNETDKAAVRVLSKVFLTAGVAAIAGALIGWEGAVFVIGVSLMIGGLNGLMAAK